MPRRHLYYHLFFNFASMPRIVFLFELIPNPFVGFAILYTTMSALLYQSWFV